MMRLFPKKSVLNKFLSVAPVLLWLSGCTIAPTPSGGAPVVDRTVYPAPPPPRPTVEINPLPRPEPIVSQQPSGPLIPQDPFATRVPPPAPAPAPVAPSPTLEPPPVEIAPQGNQAVVALLDSVRNYVNDGEYDKAAAALERALRIEPRNAGIWHDLGQIRLRQGQFRQAESMAAKSNSLAGNNRGLQARNWRLIAFARRSAGNIAGAEAAEAQAAVLGG